MSLIKKPSNKSVLSLILAVSSSSLLLIIYFASGSKSSGKFISNQKSVDFSKFNRNDVGLDFIAPSCESYYESKKEISHLKLEIPKSRQWSKNIIKAYTSDSKSIPAIHRRRFKSKLFLNNSQCSLKASVRISGDWKDHLGMHDGSPIASMDIKLKDGNIGGVTKFKLFLPKTRNGINEVVTANLFSYLGLLSPRTSLVRVNVDNLTLPYIFQEKASKEFLEFNNRRESSMYKFDESLMWLFRQKTGRSFSSMISPVVINNSWAVRNGIASSITNSGLNKLSNAFNEANKDNIHRENSISEGKLAGNSKKLRQNQSFFLVLSLITNSGHGVIFNHNRRFYYNPFLDQFEHIYYDGDSHYNSLDKSSNKPIQYPDKFLSEHKIFLDLDYAKSKLDEIDVNKFQVNLNKSGVNLDRQAIMNLKNELLNNLGLLRVRINAVDLQAAPNKNSPAITDSAIKADKKLIDALEIGQVSILEGNKVFACHSSLKECFTFFATPKQLRDIYSGFFSKDSLAYKFKTPGLSVKNYKSGITHQSNLANFNEMSLSQFKIRIYGSPDIKLDRTKKTLYFSLQDFSDKIVVYDGTVDGWKIVGNSKIVSPLKVPDVRFDDKLLTSSLTIKDAIVNDLEIVFNGGMLEDSVNLVRVKGNVSSIAVSNSPQDALDIDFSNLSIDSVSINNSGNDCIDFSSGRYSIMKSKLIGCADKGISIGEQSKAEFSSVLIRNANVAFVSKDSSSLIVEDATVTDSVFCVAAYRKKQEFAGAKITLPIDVCDSKDIFIQKNSEILLK